ncbi:MAG: hypothetical protein Q9221_006158 [Calogaya cf. arnoldii]
MASIPTSARELLYTLFQQWPRFAIPAIIGYLFLVHPLRYARLRSVVHQTNKFSQKHAMDVLTAFHIHNYLIELEFPFTFSAATTFALFKSYGIPSILSLLVQTNQLAGPPLVSSKRYADTGALLLEALLNEPGSQRSLEAFARINYLHDRWRGKGKGKGIRDEDMLYTLSLFALEPMKWVEKHEWRELSQVEICAVGTLWKFWGDALKVPYHFLPGDEKGWKDGVEWFKELSVWSEGYEERYMLPAKSNALLADATLKILLWKMPKPMHGFGKRIVATVMEGTSPRLRKAMKQVLSLFSRLNYPGGIQVRFEKPPAHYHHLFSALMTLRKIFLRYLSLPPYRRRSRLPTPSPAKDGRIHLARVRKYPWYVRPPFGKRWGPSALLARLRGDVLPGDDRKFMPEGFLTVQLGPIGLMGNGGEEMKEEVERLGRQNIGGCPFIRV